MKLEKFEGLFEEPILKEGEKYYTNGRVGKVSKTSGTYCAKVYGNNVYNVLARILKDGEIKDLSCTCHYSEIEKCKHMAAVLYYLRDSNLLEDIEFEKVSMEDVHNILPKIPKEELVEFIDSKIEDPSFRNEFQSYFVTYFKRKTKKEYEKEISNAINSIPDDLTNYYECEKRAEYCKELRKRLDNYKTETETLFKSGEYERAFCIASNVLTNLLGYDSEMLYNLDSYDDYFTKIIEKILESPIDDKLKEKIFIWRANKFVIYDTDNILDKNENMLLKYFNEEKYLNRIIDIVDGEIEKHKKDKYYTGTLDNFIGVKAQLLEELGKKDEAYKLKEENINLPSFRIEFAKNYEENGKDEEAEKLYEDGIKSLEGNEKNINYICKLEDYLDPLLELYKKNNETEKAKATLLDIVTNCKMEEIEYYNDLKALYSKEEWEKEREKVIKEIEKNYMYTSYLLSIYVEEGLIDKLYNTVISSKSYYNIKKYEKYLKEKYEKELLNKYEKIASNIESEARFENYGEMIDILKHMKTFKNGDKAVGHIIEKFEADYPSRKTIIAELNKI